MSVNANESVVESFRKWFDVTNTQLNVIDVTGLTGTNQKITKDASYEQIIAVVTDPATGYLRISR
jgi:hypothetical protein